MPPRRTGSPAIPGSARRRRMDGRLTVDGGRHPQPRRSLSAATPSGTRRSDRGWRRAPSSASSTRPPRGWDRLNWESRSSATSPTTTISTTGSMAASSTRTCHYSCAYFAGRALTPGGGPARQEGAHRRQARPEPGPAGARYRLGLGRLGALTSNRGADVDVLGITLSEEQLERRPPEGRGQAGVADRVKFELSDYRNVTGTFDRIVSVGMFEHVGRPHYRDFFANRRSPVGGRTG